jgi:ankyrin repeat protein
MKYVARIVVITLFSISSLASGAKNETPLLIKAVERGDADEVRRLKKSGIDLNRSTEYDHPPLHVAAILGNTSIMQVLIELGADPNFPDPRRSETPLHMAVAGQKLSAVKLLLDRGANLEAENTAGMTPLSEACFEGNFAIAKVLIDAGSKVTPPRKLHWSPLTAASQQSGVDLVQYLVRKGADPNLASNSGTPLMYAAISAIDTEAKVRFLLASGAKPDVPGLVYGWTPLQWSAHAGNWSIIELLVKAGGNLRQTDSKGRTLSDIASEAGHTDVAERLRLKKANP